MTDPRVMNFARILVEHSTQVKAGDKVAVTATLAAEPLLRALYIQILEHGAVPHLLIDLPDQDELLYRHAGHDDLLTTPSLFHQTAFDEFDVLIKVRSETNTRALSGVAAERQALRQKATSRLIASQMRRGADKSLRWMSTLFPTPAYAMEAEMGVREYEDFFFRALHADQSDPVKHWLGVKQEQERIIARIQGHDQVTLRGPNVDLRLSIKDRLFKNAYGLNNLPDGEVYTGPVEESVNGWVRYTYPAVSSGRMVEGVELHFEAGKVVKASASKNEAFLLRMLDMDAGARYVGEFAIGTNYEINRFTRNILLDEKIGGSFHMALGASYPETGGRNKSQIHWDMICDLKQDAEIAVDGEVVYRNGEFVF